MLDQRKQQAEPKVEVEVVSNKSDFFMIYRQAKTYLTYSVFTSIEWLETFTSQLDDALFLAFRRDKQIVGLALLVNKKDFWRSAGDCWFLNRAGCTEIDQIWPEYNNLIYAKDFEAQVWHAFLGYFAANRAQRLVVGLTPAIHVLEGSNEFIIEKNIVSPSFWLDLKPEYIEVDCLLKSFSRNTRSQIRRALKKCEAIAELNVERATTESEAQLWFEQAGRYHMQRWSDSGFKNPRFVEFHKNLINKLFAVDKVDLLKVCLGKTTLAILYCLRDGTTARFYLSGINYHPDLNSIKPGILSHMMAIQFFSAQGLSGYDFMAGENRYKKSLSSQQGAQILYSVRKNNVFQRLIVSAKKYKNKLNGNS
ncbi:GNAT family N-acetyltransferase [Gayadomonas joobiniege]|uniref:GNAT family N-acetyltransferase n=1 Tax=Gayadomonas joobiniege TaxID=1234606 RepID=UPI00036257E4|nr:GNAT family N-acetyltransferase [Gayadomonas joobiniege]